MKYYNPKDNFLDLLNYATSNWIMFADQDDYWEEDKIMNAYESIRNFNNCNYPVVSYSDLKVVDEKLNLINSSFFKIASVSLAVSTAGRHTPRISFGSVTSTSSQYVFSAR